MILFTKCLPTFITLKSDRISSVSPVQKHSSGTRTMASSCFLCNETNVISFIIVYWESNSRNASSKGLHIKFFEVLLIRLNCQKAFVKIVTWKLLTPPGGAFCFGRCTNSGWLSSFMVLLYIFLEFRVNNNEPTAIHELNLTYGLFTYTETGTDPTSGRYPYGYSYMM